MKKLILFLLLFLSVHLMAQVEWAPIGAKWYFNRPGSTTGDYVVFESIKDSTIQNKNVHVIDVSLNGTNFVSQEYVYQNGDSIFYYNSNLKSFFLLYNFSAKPGDTITVHSDKFKPTKAFFSYNDSIPYFKYKIISIDSMESSGNWIKRQKVTSLKSGDWGFFDGNSNDFYMLQGMGSLTYFFGRSGNIIPEEKVSILRCYSEPDFEYRNPIWTQDCDLISAVYDNKLIDNNMVFPNPFTNQLHIEMAEPVESIEIFDINGLKLLSVKQEKESIIVNTSGLDSGCFLLKIITKYHIYFKKLIKTNLL